MMMSHPKLLPTLLISFCLIGFSGGARAEDNSEVAFLHENTLAAQGGPDGAWLSYSWYYPSGMVREFQVIRRRDGFMTLQGYEGRYTITSQDGRRTLCQQFDDVHKLCRPIVAHKVGEAWNETFGNGDPVRLRLIKGRMLLNFLSGDGHDTHIIAPFKYPDYSPASAPKILAPGAATR